MKKFISAAALLMVAGLAVPAIADNGNKDRGNVEITFTKWLTTPPFMAGFTGGDVAGRFAGEVLNGKPTTNPNITSITWLEAVYEVQAEDPDRSFTALIRGGQNNRAGTAVLDGVILGGWRTGDRVHVEFRVVNGCGQPGAFLDRCFQGTIHIERAIERADDDD